VRRMRANGRPCPASGGALPEAGAVMAFSLNLLFLNCN